MKTRNIIVFLIVFSLFTVGAVTEDPRYCNDASGCVCDSESFTEGVEKYIKVRCEPADTSATLTRLVYLDSDRNRIQQIGDRLLNNDPTLLVSDEAMTDLYSAYDPPIFSDGTFGYPTEESWKAGRYEFGVNCTPSGLNYSCIQITISPTSTTETDSLCGDILGTNVVFKLIPPAFRENICSKSKTIKDGMLFPVKVLFGLISILGFIKVITIDGWYIWILLVEAFICVYAFQLHQHDAFSRFRAFISMNIQAVITLLDIIVKVGEFVLTWTFGLLRKISPL